MYGILTVVTLFVLYSMSFGVTDTLHSHNNIVYLKYTMVLTELFGVLLIR